MNYFVQRFKLLINLSPKIKQFFNRLTFSAMVFETIKVLPPLIFKQIIDSLVAYDPATGITFKLFVVLLVNYAGCMLLMTIFDTTFQKILDQNIRDAEVDVASRTLEKLLRLDVTYHEDHATGASVNKILKGQQKLFDLLFNTMYVLFPVIFQSFITLGILFYYSWQVALFFLIFIPIFLLIIFRGAKATQESREEYHGHYDQFAGTIVQSVSNVRTVKDFDNEEKELAKARGSLHKYAAALTKRIRTGMKYTFLQDFALDVARIATLIMCVWLMVRGHITAGTLVLIVTLSEKAYINMNRLYRVYHTMQDAEPSVDRFHEIYNAKILVEDNAASQLVVTKGKVEFNKTTFRYNKSKSEALKNVSFSIEPKRTIALVGRSGSGKSTIVKLLMRHFDPSSGTVLIDGKRTSEYSFKHLRAGIAVVSQDVELFNDTIYDNIAYGAPGASRAEVEKAAKLANAHEFIIRLEHGYDTIVGERGVKLSGGQKQRLAIARALIRNPKILIFDEATSSLDAESERYIHDSIFNLKGKLTLILIAHRFSTIGHADKIILLEKGQVKEVGTHAQLIKKKGIFAKLRKLQELGDVAE